VSEINLIADTLACPSTTRISHASKRLFFDGGKLPFPITISDYPLDRNVPRPPLSGIGAVKGHNMNETSSMGSPALRARSFIRFSRTFLPDRKI
jgi:hypothetical protein